MRSDIYNDECHGGIDIQAVTGKLLSWPCEVGDILQAGKSACL